MNDNTPKKKRGRKPKKNKPIAVRKKRGRKPKGGKIIHKSDLPKNVNKKIVTNIILHLKCCTTDLKTTLPMENTIQSYQMNNGKKDKSISFEEFNMKYPTTKSTDPEHTSEDSMERKKVWDKIRLLKFKLHNNDILDKKSDCFWCNFGFSNPPIFIPKNERNGIMSVYGCFCSPECAVAYLKNESIDTSTMWERYALLNNIYSKIYNYTRNIKPAPNPYYTLNKYYGNLTIQEYRKLLKNDRLLFVVDKPLTKIMPELYEENNEIPTIYSDIMCKTTTKTPYTQKYRLQRKAKKCSKNRILQQTFNIGNK